MAKDVLAAKLDAKIKDIAPKMQIKGFRPGKVPAAHVRKLYGKELMRSPSGAAQRNLAGDARAAQGAPGQPAGTEPDLFVFH